MGLSIDPPPRRGSSAGVNVDPKRGSLEQSLQPGVERELRASNTWRQSGRRGRGAWKDAPGGGMRLVVLLGRSLALFPCHISETSRPPQPPHRLPAARMGAGRGGTSPRVGGTQGLRPERGGPAVPSRRRASSIWRPSAQRLGLPHQ